MRETQTQQVSRILADAQELPDKLADTVAGYWLVCQRCLDSMLPGRSQIAGYFAKGWPRCCGQTMHLEPAKGRTKQQVLAAFTRARRKLEGK